MSTFRFAALTLFALSASFLAGCLLVAAYTGAIL